MGLKFHPNRGAILICDYSSGFRPPEMVKARPVVIISPRHRRRPGLCTVVPLSSSEPEPIEPYHHELSVGAYPLAKGRMWAKCDMLATVSFPAGCGSCFSIKLSKNSLISVNGERGNDAFAAWFDDCSNRHAVSHSFYLPSDRVSFLG